METKTTESEVENSAVVGDIVTDVEVCKDICSTEDEDFALSEEASATRDLTSAIGVGGLVTILVSILSSSWVVEHKGLALSAVFAIGYLGIILEEVRRNRTTRTAFAKVEERKKKRR